MMLSKNASKKSCLLFATLLLVFSVSADFYAAPGDLDPTFGNGGVEVTKLSRYDDSVRAIAVQPDGSAAPTITIPVSDTNWFFSPFNWYLNGSAFAQSQSPGAYFALRFAGTRAALAVDVASLSGAGVNPSGWPVIRWQIDSGPPQDHRLKQADVLIQLNSQALAPGTHSLRVWFVGADRFQDRWLVPVESVRVTGLVIDAVGSTLPPALRPGGMVFFGDSITEGVATECKKLDCNDATHAYPYACAAALNVEFGVVGFAGQGWTVSTIAASGVPPFPETWESQFAGQPRSFVPAPDYVVVVHGANDALARFPGDVANALQAWIGNARDVLRGSKIFVVVPFGGYERDELTQGFNAYQAAADDRNAYLIDLGPEAEVGLNSGFVKGGTPTSYDGIHPTAARSAELGAMLAQAIQEALSK